MRTPNPGDVICRALLIGSALLVVGCEQGFRPTSLDAKKARAALTTTLNAWKRGEAASTLQSASPPIVAQDLDWLTGSKLVDFQVEGDGTPMDSNLRVPVKLNLQTPKGSNVTRSVAYLITTDPALTVFRAMP